ncbi:MAG: methyl-accepting chemotaxis protein [Gemmatimonadales bacterium]
MPDTHSQARQSRAEAGGRAVGLGFSLLGIAALGLGVLLGEYVVPFPWILALALLTLAAATRRFGVALPGKWYVSFVPAAAAASAVALGWAAGGVVACCGFILGDLIFREVRLMTTVEAAGHLAAGVAVGGGLYRLLGGALGLGAFHGDSLLYLVLLFILVALIANGIVFAQMRAAGTIGRVNPQLTLRWEVVAIAFGMLLGVSGLRLLYGGLAVELRAGLTLVWVLFAGLSYFVLRRGSSAEGFLAVETMTRAIGARTSFAEAFEEVRRLTGTLVPWAEMGLARYDESRREFVIIAETAPDVQPGHRFRSDRGLSRIALEQGGPVTDRELPPELRRERHERGGEILIPLFMGGRLVGMWSVRHEADGAYWKSDAELLGRLATSLALALSLDELVGPVLEASSRTADEVAAISASSQQLYAGSEQAMENARRSAASVRRVAETLTTGTEAAHATRVAAEANAESGAATRASGQEMLAAAAVVRTATLNAADRLRVAAQVAEEGSEQIVRLRQVSELVEQFRRTIEDMAHESAMLALNATIEASRAGELGRGFGVVAQEVRALSDRSVREAQEAGRSVEEIRGSLEHASELLSRIRSEVLGVAALGTELVGRIDGIHSASQQIAEIGEQIATAARETAERSGELAAALEDGRRDAMQAAQESDMVAAASVEQSRAVEQLTETATALRDLADDLAQRVARVRSGTR